VEPERPVVLLAGERAGLVGADHVGRAERLDRGQALDERLSTSHPAYADGSARVMVGSRPSGTLATNKPIANESASLSGRPATNIPTAKNPTPEITAKAATN
jgi:hypothetical protein